MPQMDGGEDSDDEMPLTIDEPEKAPKCSKKRKKDQNKPPKSSKKSRSDFLNTSSNSNSSTSSRQPLVIDENQSDTGIFFLLCLKNIYFMLIFVLLALFRYDMKRVTKWTSYMFKHWPENNEVQPFSLED